MHFSTLAALTAIRLVCITSSAICCHARPPVREIAAYRVALWRVGILGADVPLLFCSPNRTPNSLCGRSNPSSESPYDSGRELYRDEHVGRVDVVLARFVNDSNVAFATSLPIGQNLIDLSNLEVLHAPIFHAQGERTSGLLQSHDVNPGNA